MKKNQNSKKRLLHIYVADQNLDTTSSRGIWNVSRCLLEGLAESEDPGWNVLVSVNPNFRTQMLPTILPTWMRVIEVKGPRLWLDHIGCQWINWKYDADCILFPKGWIPFITLPKTKIAVILHDCIVDFYAEVYPKYFSRLKTLYFQWSTRHSMKRSDQVFTISEFSKNELYRYCKTKRLVHVMPLGDPLPAPTINIPREDRKGILVLGSKLPHKKTAETLRLLQKWRKDQGREELIILVGAVDFSEEALEGVELLGKISDQELSNVYGQVKLLVHLSEVEGFGLPLLEAYTRSTPVVFRKSHAFAEITNGQDAGAWKGESDDSFTAVLEETLAMTPSEIFDVSSTLQKKYKWSLSVECVIETVTSLMERE